MKSVYVAVRIPIDLDKNYIMRNTEVYLFETLDDQQIFLLNSINREIENYGKGQGWPELDIRKFEDYDHEIDENGVPYFIDTEEAIDFYNTMDQSHRWLHQLNVVESSVKPMKKVQVHLDANKYNL